MDDIKEVPFEFLRKAAEAGDSAAQYELSRRYDEGADGADQSYGKAFEWCGKAAGQGLAEAQLMLGYYYKYGIGTDRDLLRAAECFVKAAAQGNGEAESQIYELAAEMVFSENDAELKQFEKIAPLYLSPLGVPCLTTPRKNADGHTLH